MSPKARVDIGGTYWKGSGVFKSRLIGTLDTVVTISFPNYNPTYKYP